MTTRRKVGADQTPSTGESPRSLTRRGFVSMVAAGGAALLASPGLAEDALASKRKAVSAPAGKAPPPAAPPSPTQKEFDRQRASTAATLKTLREYPLPPGGDLPVVFRPQRPRKRGH